MKKINILFLLLISMLGTAYAYFAGIDGRWSAMLKGPDGTEFPLTYNFKADGAKLTGSLTSSIGTFPIVDGTIKGDSLFFTADMKNMQIKNKGRYFASGDSISLSVGSRNTHTVLKRDK